MPEPGNIAPDFTLPRDGGGTLCLSALRPAPVVLFFYPRDDTSGCTRAAAGFTAAIADFEAAGARVVGLSRDSVASHEKFVARHGLAMPLVSDADGTVCAAYATWVEKSMYGRKYMGIERTTFLIAGDGRVARVWRKVRVPGHAEAVLKAVREL